MCLQLQQAYDQQSLVLQSAYREIDDLQEQVDQLHQLLFVSSNNRSPTKGKGKTRKKIR